MKHIEYQLPKRRQPVFYIVKGIVKLFTRRVKVINLGEELGDNCLYLANHANKLGPMMIDTYFPVYSVKWGAYPMLGKYSERKAYLRDVLYIQKNGYKRAKASFKAFFEAFFSKFFYKGIKVLPSYPDIRLFRTVKKSLDVLNSNTALMIFPENSGKGYFDEMEEFYSGFVIVMDAYRKKFGKDLPVRCLYYHKKKRVIVVDKCFHYAEFLEKGFDRPAIAEFMKNRTNELYRMIENGEI